MIEDDPFAGALDRVAQPRGLLRRRDRRQDTLEKEQRQRDSLLHQLDGASIASRVRRS